MLTTAELYNVGVCLNWALTVVYAWLLDLKLSADTLAAINAG